MKCFIQLHPTEFPRYVKRWISISCPFNGATRTLTALFFGYTFGLPSFIVSPHVFQHIQLRSTLLYWFLPPRNFPVSPKVAICYPSLHLFIPHSLICFFFHPSMSSAHAQIKTNSSGTVPILTVKADASTTTRSIPPIQFHFELLHRRDPNKAHLQPPEQRQKKGARKCRPAPPHKCTKTQQRHPYPLRLRRSRLLRLLLLLLHPSGLPRPSLPKLWN